MGDVMSVSVGGEGGEDHVNHHLYPAPVFIQREKVLQNHAACLANGIFQLSQQGRTCLTTHPVLLADYLSDL